MYYDILTGMRSPISIDEHYHIFNRGIQKQDIFLDMNDQIRFLFLLLYMQSPFTFQNIRRSVKDFAPHSVIDADITKEIITKRYVEIVAFCLMPNHFHLILREAEIGGISRYMQRVLLAYTKYFNIKYSRSGHLFQSSYRSVHIDTNEQLLYLSAYIHRNPREIKEWANKESKYPWSSYQDYIGINRWAELLVPNIITEQYKGKKEYEIFVKTHTSKMLKEELTELSPIYKTL